MEKKKPKQTNKQKMQQDSNKTKDLQMMVYIWYANIGTRKIVFGQFLGQKGERQYFSIMNPESKDIFSRNIGSVWLVQS